MRPKTPTYFVNPRVKSTAKKSRKHMEVTNLCPECGKPVSKGFERRHQHERPCGTTISVGIDVSGRQVVIARGPTALSLKSFTLHAK